MWVCFFFFKEADSESRSSSPDRRRRRRRRRRRSRRNSDPGEFLYSGTATLMELINKAVILCIKLQPPIFSGPSQSVEDDEDEEESDEEEEEEVKKRRRSDSYSLTFDDSLSWCVIGGLGSGRDRHSSQSSESHSTVSFVQAQTHRFHFINQEFIIFVFVYNLDCICV